jgi:hypothetical protein
MDVKCLNCGKFYSVDDNTYKVTWENFCSIECSLNWITEQRPSGTKGTYKPKKENKKDGKSRRKRKGR